jgi:diguanylate cyclase (GGDEF)-like protein/PAS domain S-box-containing protein
LNYSPKFERSVSKKDSSGGNADVLKVVLLYAMFSAAYILISDELLHWSLSNDPQLLTYASIAKGYIFIFITSVLLFGLIRRLLRQNLADLQVREEAYRILTEQSPAIIYQANIDDDGHTIFVSSQVNELGYSADEWINHPGLWKSLIHPDDTQRVMAEMDDAISHKIAFESEYRLRNKKGEWRYFHDKARIFNDANGHPLYQQGMLVDITDSKLTEIELRIAAIAFDSSDGMFITDANKVILRVNSAFIKITGYTLEEAIGKTHELFSSDHQDKHLYDSIWDSIEHTGAWEGDVWGKRKGGEVYPARLILSTVKNADDIVTNYVASLTDITASKAASDEIKNLAFFNPLTNLPNRRLLMDRLRQALVSSSRSGNKGALLFLDLDRFKTLNDTLGHDIGDLLLKQVAERLSHCVRAGDTVAHIGGDEFILLLENLSVDAIEAGAQTEFISNKILHAISQQYQLDVHSYRSTASIGSIIFNGHDISQDELLKQADIAMYQAKDSGRNTLRFFDPKMQEAINARAELENELRIAIEQKQFELYYQAQVDNSGRPIGAEALIRWLHPVRGVISPFDFIPLAEETGIILPMGYWVLDTACAQLKLWQQSAQTKELSLAVNVSAKQCHQADFVEQVEELITRHGIDPARLKLELTESTLLEDVEGIIAKMVILRKTGVRFELDDFGTGYSSLQYLKQLPLHQLKIDKSFIADIAMEGNGRTLVCTIIAMAHSLNLNVIAEGVETEEQLQFLKNNGCDHYQGYLFSKPVMIKAFEALVEAGY